MGIKGRHRRMMARERGCIVLILDSIPGIGGERVHKYLWEIAQEIAKEGRKLK